MKHFTKAFVILLSVLVLSFFITLAPLLQQNNYALAQQQEGSQGSVQEVATHVQKH